MPDLWINDRPLLDYGCALASPLEGWMDLSGRELPGLVVVGSQGEVVTGTGFATKPRVLSLLLALTATTIAERRTKVDALFKVLSSKVQLRFADQPTRYVEALALEGKTRGQTNLAFVNPEALIPLTFIAHDPLYYDVLPWERPLLLNQRTVVPMGTAGARLHLEVWNQTTSVSLVLRHGATAITLNTFTLTGTPTSSEYLRLRMNRQTIKKYSGTPPTEVDAYSWKGSLDVWPILDPLDGPVTLEFTGGTAPRGVMRGRRAYMS